MADKEEQICVCEEEFTAMFKHTDLITMMIEKVKQRIEKNLIGHVEKKKKIPSEESEDDVEEKKEGSEEEEEEEENILKYADLLTSTNKAMQQVEKVYI